MTQYTVQKGDTLSHIAQRKGVSMDQISGYGKDPNKIYPGQKLEIKGAPGEAQLPSLPGETTHQLPTVEGADPMSMMQMAIGKVGELASREGKGIGVAEGMGFMQERYGISPGDLPAGSIQQMVSTVQSGMVDPVQQRLQTVHDMIGLIKETNRENKRTAETNMDFLINTGVWNELGQESKQDLWETVGLPGTARNIREPGPTSVDVLKYDLPGFSPEMSYALHTSPTAVPGFAREIEARWKAEGKMPQDASLFMSEEEIQNEWNKLRRNLHDTGNVGLDSLPYQVKDSVSQFNKDLELFYKRKEKEWNEYMSQPEAIRKRREEQGTIPERPTTATRRERDKILQQYPEIRQHIKLPF